MPVVALTRRQRNGVADLVRSGRVETLVGGGDETRARAFLGNADAAMSDVHVVRTVLVRHDLAYAAMHDVGEAMLAAYGYRTTRGEGQHEAVELFLSAIFDSPPPSEAAAHVDVVRRNRNNRYYRAHEPSTAETDLAVELAGILLGAARARLP